MSEETIIERLAQKGKEITKTMSLWMDALDQGEVTLDQFNRERNRLMAMSNLLIEIWTGDKEDYAEIL